MTPFDDLHWIHSPHNQGLPAVVVVGWSSPPLDEAVGLYCLASS
jgi:hypothetical protein